MNNNIQEIAAIHDGMEGTGVSYTMDNEIAEKLQSMEDSKSYIDSVSNYVDKIEQHSQELMKNAEVIKEDMEILPLFSYVLVKPFKSNPFQTVRVSKSGLITDLGGMAPEYKSNETGEYEQEDQFIKTGVVYETGHKCEFVKPGDIVFYTKASEVPVPFFKQGLFAVAECRLMAVVNSNLTQRKNEIKENG